MTHPHLQLVRSYIRNENDVYSQVFCLSCKFAGIFIDTYIIMLFLQGNIGRYNWPQGQEVKIKYIKNTGIIL